MKRKILRLYVKLKNNYKYFLNTNINIGFNIANLFCKIELLDCLFNFLFRIVWIKKYLFCKRNKRERLNDEARIICHSTLRYWIPYNIIVRRYFRKLIFIKQIYIGKCCLVCSFTKDLNTSIHIFIWIPKNNHSVSVIAISLLGFKIFLRKDYIC